MPAVEVIGLTKQFVRRQGRRRVRVTALDGVSFTIARGECVAVLGCNGSGKSTLVRVLSTLLLHDGGSARVFGHDVVRDEREVRRLVNRVSVEAAFFKRLSAAENLSYAARFYGLTPALHARGGSPRSSRRVGFPARRATAPMEDLSRGMQQKVALARALLTSPTLLLLDEPTTGLDPRAKREVQAFIGEMRRTHDTTTLLCTHDMAEAEVLADRVGILDGGRLLALDTRRRRCGAATARPRSRRRSWRRRAARSRTARTTTTRRRRDEHHDDPRGVAWPGDRPAGRGRAQLLPGQALRLLGARVLRLDGRQHADDRLHRQGRRGHRRAAGRRAPGGEPAHRRGDLVLPGDRLRDPHRDRRVGALGGDDRVHVHGAAGAAGAPARHGDVRRPLRAAAHGGAVRGRGAVLRPRASRTRTSSPRSCCWRWRRSRSSGSAW